jgi:ribosomal protein S18 acetylase RimI-like enzyme
MEINPLRIQRVCSSTDPAFSELKRIYTESLPEGERKATNLLSSMIQNPDYAFLVALQKDLVVGFSIALRLLGSDSGLIEYMAVDIAHRNRGIGQLLLYETVNFDLLAGRYCIVEVDSDKTETVDTKDRTRRKAFYRRFGFREIDGLSYLMPQVASVMPPDMDLLVFRDELPEHIKKCHLRQWLESCYVHVYGLPANDQRIESMLRNIPDNLQLI